MSESAAAMREDYPGSAIRHFRDGALLWENSRISNAAQLFGLAAECAIKSALVKFPKFLLDGKLEAAYRKHIKQLWGSVPLQGIQGRYRALVVLLKGPTQPFADWSIDQRYMADNAVTEEALQRHRDAARRLLGSVELSGGRREG